ncbi:MAG: hypothetical protein CL489_10750 [Acidobacteria bacterium]|nr:hypothetical protein [Acidobacteriota bacterium]|tara:strand:- start:1084 stop:1458 length:375 start_codon:yes stop_codon:yes gene_type:complete
MSFLEKFQESKGERYNLDFYPDRMLDDDFSLNVVLNKETGDLKIVLQRFHFDQDTGEVVGVEWYGHLERDDLFKLMLDIQDASRRSSGIILAEITEVEKELFESQEDLDPELMNDLQEALWEEE